MGSTATFAQRLRLTRNQRGMTQKELAEKVGTTPATISAYESLDDGKRITPTMDNLIALANALETSLDYLCGVEQKHATEDPLEQAKAFLSALTDIRTVFGDEVKIETDVRDGEMGIYGGAAVIMFSETTVINDFLKEWNGVHGLLKNNTIDDVTYEGIVRVLCDKFSPRVVKLMEKRKLSCINVDDIPF